ncbi:MAG: hypothetical protein R2697_01215 [Ilumatobacteraceae bacterium]
MRRFATTSTLFAVVLAGAVLFRSQLVRLLTRTTGTWIGAPRG